MTLHCTNIAECLNELNNLFFNQLMGNNNRWLPVVNNVKKTLGKQIVISVGVDVLDPHYM